MKKVLISTFLASLMTLCVNGVAVAETIDENQLLSGSGELISASQAVDSAGEVIDINQASADQIANRIKGVGLVKAQAIVSFRQTNGPFKSLEELSQVKGIGMKTLERNRSTLIFD